MVKKFPRRKFEWPDDVPSYTADLTKEEWREYYLSAQSQLDYICQMMNLPPGDIGVLAIEEYDRVLRKLEWYEDNE